MAAGWFRNLFGGTVQQAIGYGTGTALGATLEPEVQAIRNEIWPLLPNVPVPPADLAAMAVQGIMHEHDAAEEAKLSGISGDRFHRLFLVNGNPIAPEEALELWNRGEIDEKDVERALLQSRLKPEWVDTFKLLRRNLVQTADLAEMVVQSVLDEHDAGTRAEMLGIHRDDFHQLVRLAGNPPGPQDTLSLWNRHIFDEGEATLALRQSRLKPEWIEKFKLSRFHPASPAEAVRGVVRQRIDHAHGQRIAAENGIDAETFALMVNTAGRPIGIAQALTLYNRGEYDRHDVEHVVAFSDVRVEFTDAILKLAVRYPSIFQVGRLVQAGAIDDQYAIELLTEQGYPDRLAADIVAAGHKDKTQAEKDLTKQEIVTLFIGGGISHDDASGMLNALGYSDEEASWILDLAGFRRVAKFLEAAINRVHSSFVAHKIGTDTVTTELDGLGVATDQREELIDLWTQERAANVKVLTPAQIRTAHKAGLITDDVATAKLIQQGYDAEDAGILLSLP